MIDLDLVDTEIAARRVYEALPVSDERPHWTTLTRLQRWEWEDAVASMLKGIDVEA